MCLVNPGFVSAFYFFGTFVLVSFGTSLWDLANNECYMNLVVSIGNEDMDF